ncbi:MAG: AAA family ATPase [Bacilli bacterium]
MLNKISSISIKRGFFDSEVKCDFFKKENQRLSIIHGRNGSGKSTIAETINRYKENKLGREEKFVFKDFVNNDLDISKNLEKIHVYDEEYIDKNVRFNDAGGFKSVVMFGEQLKIDDQIKILENDLLKIDDEIKNYSLNEFEKNNGVLNPMTHKEACMTTLKSGWSIRDKDIKGNSRATAINDVIFYEVLNNTNKEDLDSLKNVFTEKLNNYKNVSDGNEKANIISPKKIDFEDKLISIINKNIERPISNELEEKILKVIETLGSKQIAEITTVILKSNSEFCPLCMQDIDVNYKQQLEFGIKNAINEDMDHYRMNLESFYLADISFDLENYYNIDDDLLSKLKDKIQGVNEVLHKYRMLINERIDKMFDTFTENKKGYDIKFNELLDAIGEFNKKINIYNTDVKSKKQIKNDLDKLNYKISFLEIQSSYLLYLDTTKKYKEMKEKLSQATNKRDQSLKDIKLLNARKQNVGIALDKINNDLEYIFYDKNRLTLELINDKYHVKSNGKNINLKNLSTGERNAISLCYFFIDILNNTDNRSVYKNEMLVILDDPISSFDIENKIGIFSYLRDIIGQITSNNENSKIIIFTHELDSFFNLVKISRDLNLEKKSFFGQLIKKSIIEFNMNLKNDYTKLINDIYSFAKGDRDDLELTIGNTMRKVLEAYATFNYSTNIESLSIKKDILDKLDNDVLRKYFSNLMYRLVLHGDSHMEDRAYGFTENKFYDFISFDEKKRTAQEILVYLYKLDSLHIKSHIKDYNEIYKWDQHIFGDSYAHASEFVDSENSIIEKLEESKVHVKSK